MIMCVHVRMIQDALVVSLFLRKKVYIKSLTSTLLKAYFLMFPIYFSHFPTTSDNVAYEVKDVVVLG